MPANDETASTTVTAPWRRTTGPMSHTGLSVPDGVSEWTTETTAMPGWAVR